RSRVDLMLVTPVLAEPFTISSRPPTTCRETLLYPVTALFLTALMSFHMVRVEPTGNLFQAGRMRSQVAGISPGTCSRNPGQASLPSGLVITVIQCSQVTSVVASLTP